MTSALAPAWIRPAIISLLVVVAARSGVLAEVLGVSRGARLAIVLGGVVILGIIFSLGLPGVVRAGLLRCLRAPVNLRYYSSALGLKLALALPFVALLSILDERFGIRLGEDLDLANEPGLIVIGATVVPVLEEILFRGVLLGLWKERVGAGRALVMSALAFGLCHAIVVSQILGGLLLGVLVLETGSLWGAIGVHAMFNLVVLGADVVWDAYGVAFPGDVWFVPGAQLLISLGMLWGLRGFAKGLWERARSATSAELVESSSYALQR